MTTFIGSRTLRASVCTGLMLGLVAGLAGCSPGASAPPARETVDLAVADSGAARPTTAVDPQGGSVYVAYASKARGERNVYVSRLEAGRAALGAPVRVNDRPGDAAAHPQAPAQVAVGPEGTVYVAWIAQVPVEGRRFPASDIRLARSTDGGRTFAPAITVHEDAGFPTSHHFHNLAAGPDGTVYVSWLDGSARDRAERARGTVAEGNGHGGGDDGLPGTELHVARSTDGGRTFEAGVVVAEGTCQCCRTALAVGGDGTVYVAWRHIFGGTARDIGLAHSADGGRTFSEPVRVHADEWQINGCPHAGPALAVDAQDRVHVAWYTGAEQTAGIYYTASHRGGAVFGPAAVLARDVPVAQVGAALDGTDGGTWIVWEHPMRDSLYLLQVEGDAVRPAAASLSGSMPSIASAGGTIAFAWQDEAGIRLRVARPPRG